MRSFLHSVLISLLALSPGVAAESAKGRKFQSKTVSRSTPDHAIDIDVDISGAKKLFLVVDDAGDGYGMDWADWIEPRIVVDATGLERRRWRSGRRSGRRGSRRALRGGP